ncbi:rod shape-determining protein MreD [Geosporobacter ferrireducens]|uniref:Rod shape-determining protein MreD n=1 Tax=Geosporobacter ferrireducens TaxID=1424294 RepID=A0A1D8GPC7_9FIRM|nr:rod shape-determining protein MreD [Geosporobacter ferrireducens]AOT72753.1 rod shape-determining protein MreD [Geosporobacter ferrireducens]MTI55168.1 rod shape-determining protein MreD [Geosporobacter ferrireducens]
MRIFAVSMILITNFLLQSTLLQHFRVFGILPNTALILVVHFSILWGKNRGALIGFFAGLLQDIFLGNVFGVNALIYMLLGYNIGMLEKAIFKDNPLTPVLFTVLSTAIYHLFLFSLMYIYQIRTDFLPLLRNVILIEAVYNGLLSPFIYKRLYEFIKLPYIKVKTR